MSANGRQHFVAIIGGAIAGSVAAEILAARGTRVAVIEQNKRPYGKIEDGLPRWHVEQRRQEYTRIDTRLKRPGVLYVPSTKLGRDLEFQDLCNWGFSAVILANGAWRDRELGIPGADQFVGKGLIYQNPFIYWYNHRHEKGYVGPHYDAPDEALVVGGGLASIDVVKILQLENYERAMKARGLATSMHELERKGIPAVCKMHGIQPEEFGVKGCLLIYRRREQDMPLAQPQENATPEQIAKTESIRQKMLRLAREKYLFRVQDRRVPVGLVLEDGLLAGLKVAATRVEGRRAEPIPGSEHSLRAPLVVSSIGSVPEIIPGITRKGEYYTFKEDVLPQYTGCDRVFGVGNVVTGQGNIRASLVHSQEVTTQLVENYIGVGTGAADYVALYAAAEAQGAAQAKAVEERIKSLPALSESEIAALEQRICSLQERAGYTADYDSWIRQETPPDLE
ncbi:MAG TPA: FAD-dependent oxidoreductase [Bryobacteraceae bacterium]|jgi:NADPH-dependent glutamate synthase beta subunit-like oxidoreductase|nr:FAD-dependent oxidoreductase [Bryobacteraceae bacterium]